jgi:hypothetical protein
LKMFFLREYLRILENLELHLAFEPVYSFSLSFLTFTFSKSKIFHNSVGHFLIFSVN